MFDTPVTSSGLMGGASGESTLARPARRRRLLLEAAQPPIACAVCTLLYCLPSSHAMRAADVRLVGLKAGLGSGSGSGSGYGSGLGLGFGSAQQVSTSSQRKGASLVGRRRPRAHRRACAPRPSPTPPARSRGAPSRAPHVASRHPRSGRLAVARPRVPQGGRLVRSGLGLGLGLGFRLRLGKA